jgi:hypothetical protein
MSVAELPGVDSQSVATVTAVANPTAVTATNVRSEVTSGETVSAADIRAFADIGYTPANGVSTGQTVQQPIANPLHDYESYTYCLSLHMLGINDYNSLIGQDNPIYTPKNVLVSSAGRYGASFVRNPNWTEDFYFEDLKIKTVINTTKRNRNANIVEISFSLIEPLGFTLINRLLATAAEINGNSPGSYIHMPYVLQIDFFGTINGEQVNPDNTLTSGPIKGMTKIIPIRLTSVKSKLTQKGTEYQFDAVPFNHQAFNQLYISLPHNTTVTGTKITDIFGGSFDDNTVDLNFIQRNDEYKTVAREARELRERSKSTTISDQEAQSILERLSALQTRIQNEFATFGITGYCDALNAWFEDQKKQGIIGAVSAVQVVFDPEIAQKGILFNTGAPNNIAAVPASGNSTAAKKIDIQAAGNTAASNKGQIVFNGGTINIPAGTTLDRLIDWAVRNSNYIGDQIFDNADATKIRNGADPITIVKTWIDWYKIVPKIRVLSFDPLQNRYALAITFYVKKYKLSAKYPYAPKGRVPGYVKKYDYIFTGKNNDIIDLQIDFNTLYLVELTAAQSKSKTVQTGTPLGAGRNIDGTSPDSPPALNPDEPVSQNAFLVQTGVVADTNATNIRSGDKIALATKAGDLHRSLMNGARGDMINVNMRIIGDPHFIKQDDLFFGQNINNIQQQFIQSNIFQSLWMDNGELYVYLNFESPLDYDETLGIAQVNSAANKYRYSEFSGVYNIVTVDNLFVRGKFEQTLNLVKLLYDQAGQPITNVSQRVESSFNNLLQPTTIPIRNAGPRINSAALSVPLDSAAGFALAAATNPAQAASTLASMATGIASQVVGAVAGRLTQQGIDAGIKAVKSIFDSPTFSTKAADYETFKATESNYGAFGEAPTGAAPAGAVDVPAATGEVPFNVPGDFNLDTSTVVAELDVSNLDTLAGLEDLDFASGFDLGGIFA